MGLRFRNPGQPLRSDELLARVLSDRPAEERRRLLAAGSLRRAEGGEGEKGWQPGAPAVDPAALCEPGSAWLLEAAGVGADPPSGRAPRWWALAPRLPFARGELPGGVCFEELVAQEGVAGYGLSAAEAGAQLDGDLVRAALAEAGAPVLGDLRHGGVVVATGLALGRGEAGDADASQESLSLPAWPEEPVFAPDLESGDPEATLHVSPQTLWALARGHPWVLRDSETGDTVRFRPGARVRIAVPTSAPAAAVEVRVEPAGPVAARLWTIPEAAPTAAGKPASIEARVATALSARAGLRRAASKADGSDAFRLIHGEADGLPGLCLDRLGPVLRLQLSARCAEPLVPRLLDAVGGMLRDELGPDPSWIGVTRLRAVPSGRFEAVRRLRGPAPELDGAGRLCVHERGLRFLVDPGLAEPERPRPGVGLFLDQRENRARIAQRVRPGGRYLNLFAHTGAFSVALLAAGAGEVVSVDLSAAYLRWLEENLALNAGAGLVDRHRAVRSDGRRFLEGLGRDERFDGIVLDPPTAAAAGRHFWSVKRDLEPLVARALERLGAGGWLLLARNDRPDRRRARAGRDWIEGLARSAGLHAPRIEPAPPGRDFPRLAGFPEGDPFRAWLLTRGD